MKCLLAKVKIKNDNGYRRLLSDKEVYFKPNDLNDAKIYDSAYSLEEDEWFAIEEFSKQTFCIELLTKKFRSTDYGMINTVNSDVIEYLYYYDGEDYYFQRVFKHSILAQKRMLSLGDEVKIEESKKSIVINDIPDALYVKKEDKLYFKKLLTVSPIFKGIEMLYKEATREETESFLKNDFVEIGKEYGVEKVGNANRKRIALAMDTLKDFDKKQKKQVIDYTHTYYPSLEYKSGKFTLNSEEDMKYLVWGIEQRYYTTPVTKEKRVANSVSII